MGTISTTINLDKNLTVVKATGKMTAEDFLQWMEEYYAGSVTLFILWDICEADVSDIRTEDIVNGAQRLKKLAHLRYDGKTAVLTGQPLSYGLVRMLEAYSEMEGLAFGFKAFKSIDDAMVWLGIKDR